MFYKIKKEDGRCIIRNMIYLKPDKSSKTIDYQFNNLRTNKFVYDNTCENTINDTFKAVVVDNQKTSSFGRTIRPPNRYTAE